MVKTYITEMYKPNLVQKIDLKLYSWEYTTWNILSDHMTQHPVVLMMREEKAWGGLNFF